MYPMAPNGWTVTALLVLTVALTVALLVLLLVRRRKQPPTDESSTRARLEDISRSVAELQRVFSVPQSRGAIGETLLSRLLEDWLPQSAFDLQYSFRDGTRVDAVVKLGRYLVPVDAKFPFEAAKRAMEKDEAAGAPPAGEAGGGGGGGGAHAAGGAAQSAAGAAGGERAGAAGAGGAAKTGRGASREPSAELRKAFMRHVSDIAERYIRPNDGTLGFALMYIPSERVYQYVFLEKTGDLLGEAMSRGVVPVSPSTLFLYLQTVAYGLRGFAVSKDARAMLARFTAARTESDELARSLSVAGTHLKNLQKSLSEVDNRVDRLRQRLDISEGEAAEDGEGEG
ncbi:MAG: DNA recombination protein RmuC [Spirochaetota bacterium]